MDTGKKFSQVERLKTIILKVDQVQIKGWLCCEMNDSYSYNFGRKAVGFWRNLRWDHVAIQFIVGSLLFHSNT